MYLWLREKFGNNHHNNHGETHVHTKLWASTEDGDAPFEVTSEQTTVTAA
jgi:hypothetical protein